MRKGLVVAAMLTLAGPAVVHGQGAQLDPQKRRNQIQIMEGVLARAAGLGAERIGRLLQEPGVTVLIGQPRARGFILDGYGVFFDVEIPALSQTVVWSRVMMERDLQIAGALNSLKRALDGLPESPNRQQAQQAVKVVETQVAPAPQMQSKTPPAELVSAASVDSPQAFLKDPNEAYTQTVQRELIDAMLEYSVSMNLAPDEWLTVAARGAEGPSLPGQFVDLVTIVLRVKGSDLAIFAADRNRRDEIRGKVEVKVF